MTEDIFVNLSHFYVLSSKLKAIIVTVGIHGCDHVNGIVTTPSLNINWNLLCSFIIMAKLFNCEPTFTMIGLDNLSSISRTFSV